MMRVLFEDGYYLRACTINFNVLRKAHHVHTTNNGRAECRNRTPCLQMYVGLYYRWRVVCFFQKKTKSTTTMLFPWQSSWSCSLWAVQNTLLLFQVLWGSLIHDNRKTKVWCGAYVWGLCVGGCRYYLRENTIVFSKGQSCRYNSRAGTVRSAGTIWGNMVVKSHPQEDILYLSEMKEAVSLIMSFLQSLNNYSIQQNGLIYRRVYTWYTRMLFWIWFPNQFQAKRINAHWCTLARLHYSTCI